MLKVLILATALTGQSTRESQLSPRPPSFLPPLTVSEAAQGDQGVIRSQGAASRADERARLIAKRRSKKQAAYSATKVREAREAQEAAAAVIRARKEARDLLPYQLEAQRIAIRQRQVAAESQFLNRAAGAMERRAGYVYPGQSPTQGSYPQ